MPRTMPPAPVAAAIDRSPANLDTVFGRANRQRLLAVEAERLGLNVVLVSHGLHPDHPPDREPRPPRA